MNPLRKHRLRTALANGSSRAVGGIVAVIALGATLHSTVLQAVETPAPSTTAMTPSMLQSVRPYWVELTAAQRQALQPLLEDWERLDVQTKKKWVEIANRYPRMQPDEQARTQQRMREWASLTPDQRRVARDSFARVRAMNPDQRADLLRKYRELPAERRQALTSEGQANKVILVTRPPSPAAAVPVPRRAQLSEGAKVRNPALAAQKSASPIVAPARRPELAKPVLPAPLPTAPVVGATPGGSMPVAADGGVAPAPPQPAATSP